MKDQTKIRLIKANEMIFGTILKFTMKEIKAVNKWIWGSEIPAYQYIDVCKKKYNWKTGGL